MENPKKWDEVVLGSSDSNRPQAIRRDVQAGRLIKLAPRIYTSNLEDTPENIISRNLYFILNALFPGAVLSYRTAIEGGPTADGLLVLTYKYTKKINLPGITLRLIEGPGVLEGDTAFMGNLFIASRARAILENLQPARGKNAKSISREKLEAYLDKICRIHGPEELNTLRDQAKILAPQLNMKKEYQLLDKIVGALLSTKGDGVLKTSISKARSKGKPFDPNRIELFAHLSNRLVATLLKKRIGNNNPEYQKNLAFFDAYFSNYIEGTEFEVEEAADIVFHNKILPTRPEDSHDILGTYQILSSQYEMKKIPDSLDSLIHLLQKRHHIVMSARPEKDPGHFKTRANRAGNTRFVDPELVVGTLEKALDFYISLEPGIKRAIFMMLLIAEIHPFTDGNGRIARIMMNAELTATDECHIIVPTVYREDYLLTLRRLSRSQDPEPFIKMLERAQAFTASIDFSHYEKALDALKKADAFMQPSNGKPRF